MNEYIKEVNDRKSKKSPKFITDLLRYRKTKGQNHSRTGITFANFKDSVHPNQLLARCRMKKIVLCVFVECV